MEIPETFADNMPVRKWYTLEEFMADKYNWGCDKCVLALPSPSVSREMCAEQCAVCSFSKVYTAEQMHKQYDKYVEQYISDLEYYYKMRDELAALFAPIPEELWRIMYTLHLVYPKVKDKDEPE